MAAQIAGKEFPHSPLPTPLHCPVQTVDQLTLQLSATNCVIAHSQGHAANFVFPSVGEIGSVCVAVRLSHKNKQTLKATY